MRDTTQAHGNGKDVLARMQVLLSVWEESADRRDIFLRCYRMMTANMYAAIGRRCFEDSAWVERLLRRFAEYYFDALAAWETDATHAPSVWQRAHESTRHPDAAILQHLLLGVNAHINYDLVLTVDELLAGEWHAMLPHERTARHRDYCEVNAIIASTIDAVQDDILSPSIPLASLLDRMMGRLDEYLISRLITAWRDQTWDSAIELRSAADDPARRAVIRSVEMRALRMADLIAGSPLP